MTSSNKIVLGALGVSALLLVGVGALVLNWDAISRDLAEQGEQTRVTLFRLGELKSLGIELKGSYRTEPDVRYDEAEGRYVLSIDFGDYAMPDGTTAPEHAREVAIFAIGKTTKADQIDVVEVRFDGAPPVQFAREALISPRDLP